MKVSELRDDDLVKLYIALRDRRATRKAAYELDDAGDVAKQTKLEGIMLRRFQDTGAESIRTAYGTAYRSTKSYSSVADWDIFLQYVRQNDACELLTHGANKSVVEQYRAANDEVPPGVNMRTEVVVNFRRS